MDKNDIIPYLNKRVKITLRNGYVYNAVINSVSDTATIITDINNEKLTISNQDFSIIKEISENGRKETY